MVRTRIRMERKHAQIRKRAERVKRLLEISDPVFVEKDGFKLN